MDQAFWDERYALGHTGWDMGMVSPPLQAYLDQLEDKKMKILIPGAGRAYEGEYAFELGFSNTYILDISPQALSAFQKRVPHFPKTQLLCQDFFSLTGRFDLVLEQTFFCAIEKKLRPAYVEKMYKVLKDSAKLVGLFWDDPMFEDRPPFGGDKDEYETLFSPFFHIEIMETAYNSIPPRAGREFFVKMNKKEKNEFS